MPATRAVVVAALAETPWSPNAVNVNGRGIAGAVRKRSSVLSAPA
jgi:hypothetical protein